MLSIDPVAAFLSARSGRPRVRPLHLVTLAALAACDLLGPLEPLPPGAVAFGAPQQYAVWWAETEACSGRQGGLDDIEWFAVPNASVFMTSEGAMIGFWSRGSNGTRIVIAGNYLESELVVRHEMLHALLERGDHPPEYFVDRCHLTWASWSG